ncbi:MULTISPECIES: glycosyltransferase family 10 domain-containing protein [Cyanophyceae]|uniref:glycosyltransferase family 10 domain-containing protein n=1 Tax=Cyanophyceae TaxID=3028117 RepID=UPI001689DEBA|nr:glycosyltransferase family 10 [Trichocoleus sp. FACHB-69]MBD1934718.1 glycosyltransferase [Trichocoleus sp. FACHB-69]
MERKIIGMLSGYPGLNQSDWLWQQTPGSFGAWGDIQMLAQAPNPDFMLLYNFAGFPQLPQKTKWFFKQRQQQSRYDQQMQELQAKLRGVPKERIISLWREPPLNPQRNLICYQKSEPYCGYISSPDDAAPNSEYMPAIWYHQNSFRELNEMKPPEKVKICSWITSGISRSANHRKRLEFMKLLKSSEVKFDLYGRDLPDWANGQGVVNNKWYVMAPYYYNLAIENYAENDWYVSEKLWDCLLAWCLPIYYGGSAADKLLPPGSFIRLPSLDEKGLEVIKEITSTPDYWYAARDAIAEARQIILHKLNLLEWLSNFVKKF